VSEIQDILLNLLILTFVAKNISTHDKLIAMKRFVEFTICKTLKTRANYRFVRPE